MVVYKMLVIAWNQPTNVSKQLGSRWTFCKQLFCTRCAHIFRRFGPEFEGPVFHLSGIKLSRGEANFWNFSTLTNPLRNITFETSYVSFRQKLIHLYLTLAFSSQHVRYFSYSANPEASPKPLWLQSNLLSLEHAYHLLFLSSLPTEASNLYRAL